MTETNDERLKDFNRRMTEAGFIKVIVWTPEENKTDVERVARAYRMAKIAVDN